MTKLKAPFPYYGGKSHIGDMVWKRFGAVDGYIEPFAGSLAVLLASPRISKRELVNDWSPHISNFWRAMKHDPEAVASAADWPTLHVDLIARHRWLNRWGIENAERMMDDPDYFDAKAAGWWVWCFCSWSGGRFADGWATGKEQWEVKPRLLSHAGGQGVQIQRTHEKRPKIRPDIGGFGVQVQCKGSGVLTGERLMEWFQALAERLSRVIVLRRPWECALTDNTTMKKAKSKGKVAVFLDPPYLMDDRQVLYGTDTGDEKDDAARDSYEWAVKHGAETRFRIAYCCHEGDFPIPDGWSAEVFKFRGQNDPERRARRRDLIMFSPHCIGREQTDMFETV